MQSRRLVTGLAGAFAIMTAVLVVAGLFGTPVLLVLAALFGAVTYLLYAHASGRLLGRLYRGVERQAATADRERGGRGGFGAGPREEWTPPREGQRQRQQPGAGGRRRGRQSRSAATRTQTAREASEVLGVDPGADEQAVKRAYRERIKQVHPDAENGDEEAFKRVQEAYEVLTD